VPPPHRATDFTLEYVAEILARAGLITDDARRTAFARENVQRARLLREQASRNGGRGLRRAELSPVELLASFKFVDARREGELVDEDKATAEVARAAGLTYRKIDPIKLDAQLITRTLSRPFARRHAVLPLERANGRLVVATANPFDRELFENLRGLTGQEIEPVLAAPADIHRAISEVYGFRAQISEASSQMAGDGPATDVGNLEQFVDLSASRRWRPPASRSSPRWSTCCTTPSSSGPATSTWSRGARSRSSGCASTGCSTPSTASPRRCTAPSPTGSRS
jgi:general secretion pathway protein E